MKKKLYLNTFTNTVFPKPDDGKVFVKFGITHHMDAENRFNESVDDGYEKNYQDWDIKCDFSLISDAHKIEQIEDYILTKVFPNPGPTKVWVEQYLGCPDNNYYDSVSGITELRLLTEKQRKWVLWQLYTIKKGDWDNVKPEFQPIQKILQS